MTEEKLAKHQEKWAKLLEEYKKETDPEKLKVIEHDIRNVQMICEHYQVKEAS